MSRPPDLVQGTLHVLILKILALEPLNGWAVSHSVIAEPWPQQPDRGTLAPPPGHPNPSTAVPSPATSRPMQVAMSTWRWRADLVTWWWHRWAAARRGCVTGRCCRRDTTWGI